MDYQEVKTVIENVLNDKEGWGDQKTSYMFSTWHLYGTEDEVELECDEAEGMITIWSGNQKFYMSWEYLEDFQVFVKISDLQIECRVSTEANRKGAIDRFEKVGYTQKQTLKLTPEVIKHFVANFT